MLLLFTVPNYKHFQHGLHTRPRSVCDLSSRVCIVWVLYTKNTYQTNIHELNFAHERSLELKKINPTLK